MLFRDVVELLSYPTIKDDLGQDVETDPTSREVFANKRSIRQSEFYQAAVTSFRPDLMFEVRSGEYEDETRLRHEGTVYRIFRTYSKNGEITELYCERSTGDAGH